VQAHRAEVQAHRAAVQAHRAMDRPHRLKPQARGEAIRGLWSALP
jgi:hypothetical protein